MPNDAISREAAKVKEDLMRVICNESLDALADGEVGRHDDLIWAYAVVANSPIEELSAALPADRRWDELRQAISWGYNCCIGIETDFVRGKREAYLRCLQEVCRIMDRLAPATAEAQKWKQPKLPETYQELQQELKKPWTT